MTPGCLGMETAAIKGGADRVLGTNPGSFNTCNVSTGSDFDFCYLHARMLHEYGPQAPCDKAVLRATEKQPSGAPEGCNAGNRSSTPLFPAPAPAGAPQSPDEHYGSRPSCSFGCSSGHASTARSTPFNAAAAVEAGVPELHPAPASQLRLLDGAPTTITATAVPVPTSSPLDATTAALITSDLGSISLTEVLYACDSSRDTCSSDGSCTGRIARISLEVVDAETWTAGAAVTAPARSGASAGACDADLRGACTAAVGVWGSACRTSARRSAGNNNRQPLQTWQQRMDNFLLGPAGDERARLPLPFLGSPRGRASLAGAPAVVDPGVCAGGAGGEHGPASYSDAQLLAATHCATTAEAGWALSRGQTRRRQTAPAAQGGGRASSSGGSGASGIVASAAVGGAPAHAGVDPSGGCSKANGPRVPATRGVRRAGGVLGRLFLGCLGGNAGLVDCERI